MELDVFVQTTLEQIVDGVSKARAQKGNNVVDPSVPGIPDKILHRGGNLIQSVEFDVAVTVQEKSAGEAGGKISVLAASIGGTMNTDSLSSKVTRIKFTVPVCYSGQR